MRRILVLFIVLVAALMVAPTTSTAGLQEFCAARWPGELAKQRACFEANIAAFKKVKLYRSRHDILRKLRAQANAIHNKKRLKMDPYVKIYGQCAGHWWSERYQTVDYVKFSRCLHKEEKAYNARAESGGSKRKHQPNPDPTSDRFEDKLSPMEGGTR